MKIKTTVKLQEKIDAELSWRKKELINFASLVHNIEDPILCKMGIALLSAHFEGFIKKIANYYVIFVSDQKKKASELKRSFSALYLSRNTESQGAENMVTYERCLEKILSDNNLNFSYTDENPIIKTQGNPSSTLLRNIFKAIGLDFGTYETKVNYIDTDLLSNRHKIVHGEKIDITKTEFDDTFKHILELMEKIALQISDSAINHNYLQ